MHTWCNSKALVESKLVYFNNKTIIVALFLQKGPEAFSIENLKYFGLLERLEWAYFSGVKADGNGFSKSKPAEAFVCFIHTNSKFI